MVRKLNIECLEARELKSVNSITYKIANGKDIQLKLEEGVEVTEETAYLESLNRPHSVGDRNGDGLDDVFFSDGDGQMWLAIGQSQPTKSSYIRSNGISVFPENEPYLQKLPYHHSFVFPGSPLYAEVQDLLNHVDDFFDFNGDGIEDTISWLSNSETAFIDITFGQAPFAGWVDPVEGLVLNNTNGDIDIRRIEVQGENISLRDNSPFDALVGPNGDVTITIDDHTSAGEAFAVGVDVGCNLDREIELIVSDVGDNIYQLKVPVYDRSHGDLNGSGTVDFQDYLLLAANFGSEGVGYTGGDIDGNGIVDFRDFLTFARSFGDSVGC